MIYREWLVMRKAVLVFVAIVVSLSALFGWLAAVNGHYHVNFSSSFVGAAWFTAFFASIFGVALGNGSREGARVFWVLPRARWRSAVEIVGVDLAAITVTFVAVAAAGVIVSAIFVAIYPHGNAFVWDFDLRAAPSALLMTFGVYSWSALVGMVGRRVPYVGVAVMPVLMVWFALAQSGSALGQVLRLPILSNPVVVYEMQSLPAKHDKDFGPLVNGLLWMTPDIGLGILAAIAVVGCAAAIVMWQRAEVLA